MFQMYSIRDSKSGAFERPFFAKHVAEATRNVQLFLENSKDHQVARFPEDFSLWQVGSFDPSNGGLMPTHSGAPQWVIELAVLVNQAPQTPPTKFKTSVPEGKEVQSGA